MFVSVLYLCHLTCLSRFYLPLCPRLAWNLWQSSYLGFPECWSSRVEVYRGQSCSEWGRVGLMSTSTLLELCMPVSTESCDEAVHTEGGRAGWSACRNRHLVSVSSWSVWTAPLESCILLLPVFVRSLRLALVAQAWLASQYSGFYCPRLRASWASGAS